MNDTKHLSSPANGQSSDPTSPERAKNVPSGKNFKQLLKEVEAMVFDVDGVLSTSSIPLAPGGEPMRVISTKDGYALHLAARLQLPMAIITGGSTEAIRVRFEGLGLKEVHMGVSRKKERLHEILDRYGVDIRHTLYMGDDFPDYECMASVGIPVCPADAAPEIKAISLYVSPLTGGNGCVRDVVEQCLKAKGLWMSRAEAFGW